MPLGRRNGRVRPAAASSPAPPFPPVGADGLVTVVVCTLGREPRLTGTVQAVLGQSHRDLELVVVDNDPTSGRTAAMLAGVDDLRLRIVPEPVRGLSAARNAGLAAADGPLVAYTDDDAVPDPDWITRLVDVVRADADGVVACVTGRVLSAESTSREQEWFEEAGIFDKGTERTAWSLGTATPPALGRPGRAPELLLMTAGVMGSGNSMAFRTAALQRLGGFDEALGAGSPAKGGEDLDVFRRVLLAGHVLVYTPDAVVRHHHRASHRALRRQMYDYGVGMSAVVTKLLTSGGRPARAVLTGLPAGVRRLVSPRSERNEKKPAGTPRDLLLAECAGYLVGPVLYARSRARARRVRRPPAGP